MNVRLLKQNALLAAVKAKNFEQTKKLLGEHGLILDHDFSDYKLLVQALCLGDKKIAKLLLDNGCRVFCPEKTGTYSTPLYYAVNLKCLELVEILLDKGASVKGKDGNKVIPLIFALQNKYFDIVDLMLSKYKIKKAININNNDEVAYFYIACIRNNTALVKIFIEHGMKVDQTNNIKSSILQLGYTPLHFAVENQAVKTVKLLLSNKANFGLKNLQGLTPLHIAFLKDYKEIIDSILSAHLKVMINPIDIKNGISHFHIACSKFHLELLKSFLKSGADCNACIFSNSSILPGYTPIHIAIKYNCKETVKFLLDHKADVNKGTSTGMTPLHLAIEIGNIELVKLLVEYNADVCTTDSEQNTAIHKAFEKCELQKIEEKYKAIIILLLSVHQGKLKNVSDNFGISLFHIACLVARDTQIIKNFLKQNADINAYVKKNSTLWADFTTLHFAVMGGNIEIIQILLDNVMNVGCNLNNSDDFSLFNLVCGGWLFAVLKFYNMLSTYQEDLTEYLSEKYESIQSIDEHFHQILKLLLKYKRNTYEIYRFTIFDVCEIMYNFLNQIVDSRTQNERFYLRIKPLFTTFNKIIITFLDYGYDINAKGLNNISTLHFLIEFLNLTYNSFTIQTIELLLIRGADVDIEAENGITPLMMAARFGFDEVVQILLKYKADPNKYSEIYMTSLHFAIFKESDVNVNNAKCRLKIVDLLLANGANANVQSMGNNYTPLILLAAQFECLHKILVRFLLYNCDVNSKNNDGDTALHIACKKRNLPGLKTLLNYGADINLVNNKNLTPLRLMFLLCKEIFLYKEENFEMLKILELHIIKLNFIGYKVSKQNNRLRKHIKIFCKNHFSRNNSRLLDSNICDKNEVFIDFCKRELEIMKNVKINMYTSLYSIIFKNAHEVAKNVNNENFKELVNSEELTENFPLYGYILNLQYKKGLERYPLLKAAIQVLKTLFNLPNLCNEHILASFSNQELEKLIGKSS